MMQPGWNPLEMMLRGSMPPGTTVPSVTDTKQQTNSEAKNDEETKTQAVISNFQNVEGFKESMADDLTTGSIAIKQVPKKRLYEFLEFLKPGMDAVTLGGLNQAELAVVIWILSGMRPNSGIHDFIAGITSSSSCELERPCKAEPRTGGSANLFFSTAY